MNQFPQDICGARVWSLRCGETSMTDTEETIKRISISMHIWYVLLEFLEWFIFGYGLILIFVNHFCDFGWLRNSRISAHALVNSHKQGKHGKFF